MRASLAGLGAGLLAVVCCATAPLLIGALSGAALSTVLDAGASVLAAAAIAVLLLVLRGRRRRPAGSVPGSGREKR